MVRVNGTISEAFSISSGVRQGCVLAANLFNTATDRILNNTTQALTLGVNYDDSGQHITDLDYADDIVIFADLLDTLKDALYIFNEQSQTPGLHVNWSKTKLQSFSPWIPTPPSTLIGTQPVTTTDNFTYLGSTIASNNSSLNDVNRRIAIATSTMSKLSSLWTSSRLSLALKMRLYNSLICRLQPGTQAIDILASTPPSSWRSPRGRPPLRWADQIVKDTQMSLRDAVTATQYRSSWRSLVRDATRPATQVT